MSNIFRSNNLPKIFYVALPNGTDLNYVYFFRLHNLPKLICGVVLNLWQDLIRDVWLSCSSCDYFLSTKTALVAHQSRHKTKDPPRDVICEYCPLKFQRINRSDTFRSVKLNWTFLFLSSCNTVERRNPYSCPPSGFGHWYSPSWPKSGCN